MESYKKYLSFKIAVNCQKSIFRNLNLSQKTKWCQKIKVLIGMWNYPGLPRFQNTLTTNFKKTSLTSEIDYYAYEKLLDKNSGF